MLIDGMVFDVTRWLPQHPGGSIIIPEQAVNIETVVLFEMYHSSRMSFQFLREFYIGDLLPEDLEKEAPFPLTVDFDEFYSWYSGSSRSMGKAEVKVLAYLKRSKDG